METTRAQQLEEKFLSFYIYEYNKIKDERFGGTILNKINIKDISKEIAIADHMVDEYYKFLCSKFLMPLIYRDDYYYADVLYLTEILFPQKILEVYTEYKNTKPLYYFKTPEGYVSYRWFNHKLGFTTPVYFGISLHFLSSIESMIDWINDNKKLFQYKYHLVEDQYDELYHSIKYPITIPDFENLDLYDLNKNCEENRKSIFEGKVLSSVLDNKTRWENLDKDLIGFFNNQEYISLDTSSITKAFIICEDDNKVIQNSKSFKNMIKKANETQVKMFKSDYQIKDVISKSVCITIEIEDDDKNNMSYITVDIPVTDKFFKLDESDRSDWVKLNITDLIEIADRNISTFDNINQHVFFSAEIVNNKKLVRLMFRALDYRKGFEFYRKKIDSVMQYLSYKELDDLCDVENFIDLYVKWWTKDKKAGLLPDYIDIYRKVEAFFWSHILSVAMIKDRKMHDIIDVSKVYDDNTAYRFISIMVDNSKSFIYTKTFNVFVERYHDGEEFYKYLQSTEVKKKFHISPSARRFEFVFGGIGVSQFINDCYPKEKYKSFMIDTLSNMIKDKYELELLAKNIGSIGITVEEFSDIIHKHMRDESQSTHIPISLLDIISQHPDIYDIIYINPTVKFNKYTGSCLKFDFIDVDVCINADLRKESMPIIIETVKEYIPLITEIVLITIEHKKQFKDSHLTRNDLVLSKPYILPDGTIHYSFDIKGHLLPEEYPENKEVGYNGFGNPVKICGLDKESCMRLRFDKKFFLL